MLPTCETVPVPRTQRSLFTSSKAHTDGRPLPAELADERGNGWVRFRRVVGAQGADAQMSSEALG
jgi:hypothetical protein